MEIKPNICIILILSYFHHVQAGVHIDITSREVSEGTEARLECYSTMPLSADSVVEWRRFTRYSSSAENLVRWTRTDGSEITTANVDNHFNAEGGLRVDDRFRQELIIRHTKRSDQGEYFCVLLNETNEIERSSRRRLVIKYPPADHFPLCWAIPDEVKNVVRLTCESEITVPPTTIQWYKGKTKVAEGIIVDFRIRSTYEVERDEMDSPFECHLDYDNEIEIQVHRSCRFSRPEVILSKSEKEISGTEETRYHVFGHSSPPFISDLNCSLESSTATRQDFHQEYPGYGVMTVGPVASVDNGTNLVCRARNAFGFGESTLSLYHYDSQHEANVPVSIWPVDPVILQGGSVMFACKYKLADGLSPHTGLNITWKYNDTIVRPSMTKFTLDSNILWVREITEIDNNVIVSCHVKVVDVHGHQKRGDSRSTIKAQFIPCAPKAAVTSKQDDKKSETKRLTIALTVFGITLVLTVAVFILILHRMKRNGSRFASDAIHPQVTFRSELTTGTDETLDTLTRERSQNRRALPAEPADAGSAFGHVDAAPAIGNLRKSKLESVSSGNSAVEMAYQEMVGDTGVVGSRHGSIASNVLRDHPTVLCRSYSIPASMIPVPRGGFLPSTGVSAPGHRSAQRSLSETQEPEWNYEDPDFIRERRRLQRTMSNDYQPPIRHDTPLSSRYANSCIDDGAVFTTVS